MTAMYNGKETALSTAKGHLSTLVLLNKDKTQEQLVREVLFPTLYDGAILTDGDKIIGKLETADDLLNALLSETEKTIADLMAIPGIAAAVKTVQNAYAAIDAASIAIKQSAAKHSPDLENSVRVGRDGLRLYTPRGGTGSPNEPIEGWTLGTYAATGKGSDYTLTIAADEDGKWIYTAMLKGDELDWDIDSPNDFASQVKLAIGQNASVNARKWLVKVDDTPITEA